MSLFFDMKELTSFAQNKSSSAGIDSYDDTCNERLDLRSDWLSKMFRRHFLEHKMSDPEAKLYNSRILDRLKRWCGAHGCAALASGKSYILCTPPSLSDAIGTGDQVSLQQQHREVPSAAQPSIGVRAAPPQHQLQAFALADSPTSAVASALAASATTTPTATAANTAVTQVLQTQQAPSPSSSSSSAAPGQGIR